MGMILDVHRQKSRSVQAMAIRRWEVGCSKMSPSFFGKLKLLYEQFTPFPRDDWYRSIRVILYKFNE
jgi:hypothetical protein